MIVPGRTTLLLAAALAAVTLAAAVEPFFLFAALGGDGLLLLVCLFQGRRLAREPIAVERVGWNRLEIGRETEMVYRIQNRGEQAVVVILRQPWPPSFTAPTNQLTVTVESDQSVTVALSVTASRRGRVGILPSQVDVHRPSDLVRRRVTQDDATALTVYPNLRAMAQYDMLRRHHALGQFGLHHTRMVGTGKEFDQLRDYLPDDNFGNINWKATARRRRLVTNVYRAERSQDVMLCLDCGRMMGNPLGSGTVLDRVVDAATMLVHVCTRWGDRVGLALFRDTVTQYIKPTRVGKSANRIIDSLVGATPEGVFPSYAQLAAALRVRQTRRAMVFIFTDLNDPQLAANLTETLGLINRRHVVVVVSLRDPLLDRIASGPAADRRAACQVLAARHLSDERSTRVREIVKTGVRVLEVDADSITIEAINAYMAIKMRQLV